MAKRKKNDNRILLFRTLAVLMFLLTAGLIVVFVVSERNGHIIATETFLVYGTLIAGVAFLGLCFLLAGTPQAKRPKAAAFGMSVLFVVYLVVVIGLLYGGARNYTQAWQPEKRYNIKPFSTIKLYVDAYKTHSLRLRQTISNLIGNIVLFIPMAWFVPFLFPPMRKWYRFFPVMLLVICLVEVSQFITGRGSMDIDDVIENFAGLLPAFVILWNPLMVKLWKKTGLIAKK